MGRICVIASDRAGTAGARDIPGSYLRSSFGLKGLLIEIIHAASRISCDISFLGEAVTAMIGTSLKCLRIFGAGKTIQLGHLHIHEDQVIFFRG